MGEDDFKQKHTQSRMGLRLGTRADPWCCSRSVAGGYHALESLGAQVYTVDDSVVSAVCDRRNRSLAARDGTDGTLAR